jgi:hypothetical protein
MRKTRHVIYTAYRLLLELSVSELGARFQN